MEPIKNALAQAGDFVQQAVHAVVEVFQGNDETQGATASSETEQDKNIDSRTKQFEKEQTATLEKSEITKSTGGYQDAAKKSDAKVLQTSWPDLKGKTRHEAEELIKAKGYSNIKVMKKGTSSSTEHDESRVILYVDDNDIVVEEPKVG